MYEDIPHVEFKGYRIYHAESKLAHLKTEEYWTPSKVQRTLKCGHAPAMLLIEYAQSLAVLDLEEDSYGRFKVLVEGE